jgi:hypothetical protein
VVAKSEHDIAESRKRQHALEEQARKLAEGRVPPVVEGTPSGTTDCLLHPSLYIMT